VASKGVVFSSDEDEDTDEEEITNKTPKKRLQKGRKMADADTDKGGGGQK
jgi:hypothetical protein